MLSAPLSPLLPGGAPRKNFRRDHRTGRAVGSGVAVRRGHDQKGKFAGLRAAGQAKKFFSVPWVVCRRQAPIGPNQGIGFVGGCTYLPSAAVDAPRQSNGRNRSKKQRWSPLSGRQILSAPKRAAGETCPSRCQMALFLGLAYISSWRRPFAAKRALPAQTGPAAPGKKGGCTPLSPKIARKQRLEKEATRSCPASAPRNELLPGQMPFPPGFFDRSGSAGNLCVCPLSSTGRTQLFSWQKEGAAPSPLPVETSP